MHSSVVRQSESSVYLVCEATSGDPPISYSWTDPNGRALSSNDTDGRISITVTIYGTYTCTVTNQFVVDKSTVELLEPGNYA